MSLVVGEVKVLRSSMQPWVLLGEDTKAPTARVLIRGRIAGADKTVSITRAAWDDVKAWRQAASAEGSS